MAFNLFLLHRYTDSIVIETLNSSILNKKFYQEIFKLKNIMIKKHVRFLDLYNYCEKHSIDNKVYKRLKLYISFSYLYKRLFFYKFFKFKIIINELNLKNKILLYIMNPILKFIIYFF